jgi:hypothetical protein
VRGNADVGLAACKLKHKRERVRLGAAGSTTGNVRLRTKIIPVVDG